MTQINGGSPHHLKLKNVNRLAIGHLNINYLHNKFDILKRLAKNSSDIFIISETKLDETSRRVSFLWMGLSHHIGWIEMQIEVV